MLNKLCAVQKVLNNCLKALKRSFYTWMCLYVYKLNLNIISMFSVSLLFYELGTYWFEIIQMYGEKGVARNDPRPDRNLEWGS